MQGPETVEWAYLRGDQADEVVIEVIVVQFLRNPRVDPLNLGSPCRTPWL